MQRFLLLRSAKDARYRAIASKIRGSGLREDERSRDERKEGVATQPAGRHEMSFRDLDAMGNFPRERTRWSPIGRKAGSEAEEKHRCDRESATNDVEKPFGAAVLEEAREPLAPLAPGSRDGPV
ncbi:hypothetical protein KM043_003776 [Ampulex compressa]|nr:hypothetical protein KM043_003776 [Ampulex compressa]